MKICTKCNIEYDESFFYKHARQKSGLQSQCKECIGKADVERKKRNTIKNSEINNKENIFNKTCYVCKLEKLSSEFSICKSNGDGLQMDCKECASNRVKERRKADPEGAKESDNAYYAANTEKFKDAAKRYNAKNPNKKKEIDIAYRSNNREKIRIAHAIHYAENSETINKKNSEYRKANPDAYKSYKHNRRAKEKEVGGKLSPDLYPKLFKLQRGCCAICKIKLPLLGKSNPMDHVVPITPRPGDKQGTNTDDNMQLLCQPCNNRKHNKDPLKFMQEMGYLI